MRLFLFSALGLLLSAGCATSSELVSTSYDDARDVTRYEARRISLGRMFSGNALGGGRYVNLRAWATCRGQGCQPQQAWLSFAISGSANRLQVYDRSITMRTEEERLSWPQREVKRPAEETSPLRGKVARIALDPATLETIATAQQVSGAIGNESFSLSYEQRAPLRELAARISD